MSLLGGGTRAAVGRSGPCSSIDADMRGNGRSKAPKAKACMRSAAVATATMKSAGAIFCKTRNLQNPWEKKDKKHSRLYFLLEKCLKYGLVVPFP